VYQGQIWATSTQLHTILDTFARIVPPRFPSGDGPQAALSKREREVAELVAEGLSNRDIASQLGLSEHTIKNYLFHIFEKLGMSSRVELVLYARHLEPEAVAE
jgi:DNA-binding NarL/FixJ family response regulator